MRETVPSSGHINFYPRSPCGERRWLRCWQLAARDISIHALLAESDGLSYFYIIKITDFYPRSPCGERQDTESAQDKPKEFLSTLSLRRATQIKQTCRAEISISIHALLAESDRVSETLVPRQYQFLSTLSLRRATVNGDVLSSCFVNFYPRSPCGERRNIRNSDETT